MQTKLHPGRILRNLMSTKCVMMPGAFNGLVGRIVAAQGFEATYISGAALTASSGVPDIGLLGLESFSNLIQDVYNSSGLPIIADCDTGFGQGEMCAKTVWTYNKAGAAGLHIEDQQFPKRCGHLDGKTLIPLDDMVMKLKICAQARDVHSNGTDARGVEGIESVLSRAIAYIDAGADMIFPEGLSSIEEFEYVGKKLREHKQDVFLLANMTEFGKTPESIKFGDLEKIGYSCVIYPVSTLRIAMGAVNKFLHTLKEEGSVQSEMKNMLTRQELYDLLNYEPGKEWMFPSKKDKE